MGTTAPTGWVFACGKTIGNASSAATERANADTFDLFVLLWSSMANTEAAVSGGRGASAAADFAANKTIVVPDLRGRSPIGKDNMGGTAAGRLTSGGSSVAGTTLGAAGGAESHTLTAAQIPAHAHTITDPGHSHTANGQGISGVGLGAAAGSAASWTPTTVNAASTGITGTNNNTGGGNAHPNVHPVYVTNVIIKL